MPYRSSRHQQLRRATTRTARPSSTPDTLGGLSHATTWSVTPSRRSQRDRGQPFRGLPCAAAAVRPVRREVDDLPLVDAEDAVGPARDQQRQVGERAEAAVAHQDVAAAEVGMEPRRRRPCRGCAAGRSRTSRSIPVPAWNRARMWATGKPQPGLLPGSGWPKWAWSSGVSGIENAEPSTRKMRWPRQVPVSPVASGSESATAAEHGLEDRQRQAGPGLAVGRGGERAAGQEGDVADGGVAVEDLDEEPVEDGDGVEAGSRASDGRRCGRRRGWRVDRESGRGLAGAAKDANDPVMHQGASCTGWRNNTIVTGGPSLCNLFREQDLSHLLNAIRPRLFFLASTPSTHRFSSIPGG